MFKSKIYILFLIVCIGCSTDDASLRDQQLSSRVSTTCQNQNVTGLTGLYWDITNGDLNAFGQIQPVPPVIQNPGDLYIHSQQPILSFTIPQGFSAFEATEPSAVGVNILRNDNQVLYRWVPLITAFQPLVPTQAIIEQEINTMLSFYNFQGQPEVLCSATRQNTNVFPQEFNARLLRFNGMIAQVWVLGTYIEGVGSSNFAISISVAPEEEFGTQVQETFLPFIFQLYVRPDGEFIDNDNDGVDVLIDPDDTDPNVP